MATTDDRSTIRRDTPISATTTTAAALYIAAVLGAVNLVALLLFCAVELDAPPQSQVFGPLSDIGGAGWNLLLIPVVIGFGTDRLPRRGSRLLLGSTVTFTAAAAAGSALMVVGVLAFEASTALSVIASFLQFGWLFAVSSGLRQLPNWSRLGRFGKLIGVGELAGVLLVGASLLLDWGTPAQVVVMVAGLIPGLLAWFCLPVWVLLLARGVTALRRPAVSTTQTSTTHWGAS